MSDKEILTSDDDSFKELQIKWRNNSLSDDEKDLYIKHLTLRHIDRKRSSRELQAENERLNQRLAEYESTPERGLKSLMSKHAMVFETAGGISVWSHGNLALDVDSSNITAEDIE